MSFPPLVPLKDATLEGWQRKVRDAINGVVQRTSGTGTTAERPNNPTTGTIFFDQTLGRPVWWNGSSWRDASGGVA